MKRPDGLTDAEFLRGLAQNDYNIDGHLLPDGVDLEELADRLEALERIHEKKL